jgi:hypothetical protein
MLPSVFESVLNAVCATISDSGALHRRNSLQRLHVRDLCLRL